MWKNIAVLATAVTLLVHAGCGDASKGDGPEILKIKGLYLGMSIDEAKKILTQEIGEKGKVNLYESDSRNHSGKSKWSLIALDAVILADSGLDKKVDSIYIGSMAVRQMFKVKDVEGKKLAQSFASTHGIPSMEPFKYSQGRGIPPIPAWKFTSASHGYTVTVYNFKRGFCAVKIVPAAKQD